MGRREPFVRTRGRIGISYSSHRKRTDKKVFVVCSGVKYIELFTDVAECPSLILGAVVSVVVWFVPGRKELSLALQYELTSTALS